MKIAAITTAVWCCNFRGSTIILLARGNDELPLHEPVRSTILAGDRGVL